MARQHRGGRPANPRAARMHVTIDPKLKERMIIRATKDGVPVHKVLDAALRAYLSQRGTR